MLSSSQSRIDMIGAACESAEKVLADTRKAYCFGTRQGPQILPTLDKGQALKIQELETLLRAAVNSGEGDTLYSLVSYKLLHEPAYISFASSLQMKRNYEKDMISAPMQYIILK